MQLTVALVCSYRDGVAAVTWTTDADLRVNDVHADRFGPSLDQPYQWWSAHTRCGRTPWNAPGIDRPRPVDRQRPTKRRRLRRR